MIAYNKVKKFCCEDLSKIENYAEAVNDQTQIWECHHRKGIELNMSKQELIDAGLYFNRPASELIFLTQQEHKRLHLLGNTRGWKKGKPSWNKGLPKEQQPNYGKHWSEEAKNKMSNSNKGKHNHSTEIRAKISKANSNENHPKARAVYQIDKSSGEIIKRWKCIKYAANELGIRQNCICACCKGYHKTAGGYVWKYADDLEKVV